MAYFNCHKVLPRVTTSKPISHPGVSGEDQTSDSSITLVAAKVGLQALRPSALGRQAVGAGNMWASLLFVGVLAHYEMPGIEFFSSEHNGFADARLIYLCIQ